jgi:hypothetical protein
MTPGGLVTEDTDTERAIDALAYRLRNRGDADIEVVAREFMVELRARGWRPTEARVLPEWRHPAGSGTEPNEDWQRARAELEEKLSNRPPQDAA